MGGAWGWWWLQCWTAGLAGPAHPPPAPPCCAAARPSCRGAAFHFWDATDDITGASLDLLFERDCLYLHNARGAFGAVPMTLTGEPRRQCARLPAGWFRALAVQPAASPAPVPGPLQAPWT